MDPKKVGKTIAFLRNYYGMTQWELAKRLGVSDKAISRWECGQGTPDISLLGRLSNVLDTEIESILEGNLTHMEIKWKGILVLNYAEGISPWGHMFGKRIVEFQIGFLCLLASKRYVSLAMGENLIMLRTTLKQVNDMAYTLSMWLMLVGTFACHISLQQGILKSITELMALC